jgi:hypothetical protein
MGLDVLLEVLRALERLAAEVALVRLERHVDADVRRDVVALDRGGAALVPLARQAEVVGALAADVLFADVFLGGLVFSSKKKKEKRKKKRKRRPT